MSSFIGEHISEKDREELIEAAYMMQEAYQQEKTWYDAIAKVSKRLPKVPLWQLEGMWRAIDAYVDINL
jgi:hypothetical protein